jgi:hypothetical protein
MNWRLLCLVAVLLLLAGSAVATPKKLGSCGTITESGPYVVTDNINAAGDCFIIAADYVSIDFAGNVLTGNGTGYAVRGNGVLRRGLAFRGGTIRNFQFGIGLASGGILVTVENMFVFNCSSIGIGANEFAMIRNNTVSENHDGIAAGPRSVVVDNISGFNTGSGINAGAGSVVARNNAGHNGNNGIVTQHACTVQGNAAHANANFGIYVICPSTLIDNAAANNNNVDLFTDGTSCNRGHNVPLP